MSETNEPEPKKFTHLGIELITHRMVSILSKVQPTKTTQYDLVRAWARDAWEDAKLAGLVTDAMLEGVAAETK